MYVCIILALIVYILYTHFKPVPKPVPVVSTPAQPDFSAKYKEELEHCREELRRSFTELGQVQSQLRVQTNQNQIMEREKTAAKEAYERLFHQKKSSEVRTGFFAEALLPLHESFPVDPKSMRFLGSPIDYISFDYDTDMITFVEVKTGSSVLNENQRKVKKMVENGRVQFKVVRLDENGIKVK